MFQSINTDTLSQPLTLLDSESDSFEEFIKLILDLFFFHYYDWELLNLCDMFTDQFCHCSVDGFWYHDDVIFTGPFLDKFSLVIKSLQVILVYSIHSHCLGLFDMIKGSNNTYLQFRAAGIVESRCLVETFVFFRVIVPHHHL